LKPATLTKLIVVAAIGAVLMAAWGMVISGVLVADNEFGDPRTIGGRICYFSLTVAVVAQISLLFAAVSSFKNRHRLRLAAHVKFSALLACELVYLAVAALTFSWLRQKGILTDTEVQPLFMINGWFGLQAIILMPFWMCFIFGLTWSNGDEELNRGLRGSRG
jgi:hypothetical protein